MRQEIFDAADWPHVREQSCEYVLEVGHIGLLTAATAEREGRSTLDTGH